MKLGIIATVASALTLSVLTAACSSSSETPNGGGGEGGMGASSSGGSATGGGASTGGSSGGTPSTGGQGGESCSTLDIATQAGLTSLVAAVEKAGLAEAVEGENLTIFAPTNEAFASLLEALGKESLDDLAGYQLAPILLYHVAGSVIDSEAALAAADGDGSFSTLGGTVAIEGNATDGLFLDPSEANAEINLSMIDVEACNGTIVHVIDAVILPSITDIVVSNADFSGLKGLVTASDSSSTDVAEALDGPSPAGAWTLFAPSNTAAAGAPSLSASQITDVLLYHAYASEDAVDSATAVTLDATIEMANGDDLDVLGSASPVSVTLTDAAGNDVEVDLTKVDIYASNGIIHGIPSILIPEALVP